MKRTINIILVLAIMAVSFAACNTRSVFSPGIQTAKELIRTSAAGVTDTIAFTDSVNIGDTVRLGIACNGYYDYLNSVVLSGDTSKVHLSLAWVDSLNYVLADDADPAHGRLTFLPEKAYAIYTTLTYVPVVSGTHRIDILITSAAPDPYSQSDYYLNVAVK